MNRSNIIRATAIACLLVLSTACQQVAVSENARNRASRGTKATTGAGEQSGVYGPPAKLGVISNKEISESSGIVSSRTTPGVYWTHNDSGGGPFLYALDQQGANKGVWRVTGATSRDWEDIAVGPGPVQGTNYLYIGDIGDNRGTRTEIIVNRVPEPLVTPADASSSRTNPISTSDAEIIRLRYPDGNYDSEALLVHPRSGNIYVVTKIPLGDPMIYEAKAPFAVGKTTTMVRVGVLSMPGFLGGLVTGGDISPDGMRVALCDYDQGYELVLPDANAPFNQIWKQPLIAIDLGERKQGEAIGYRLDGRALLATSEGKRAPLLQVERR
jgi:hypothetical protein